VTDSPIRLLLVVLLIAVNGFFAGAEVSLLSVRYSRLRQMAAEGNAGAQAPLNLLSNPGRLLSVTQVGVTLASLGLGWAGEDTIYRILVALLHSLITPVTAKFLHGLSFLLSFLVISYFHVVLGEVVPKNLAIAKSAQLAALTAPALVIFYRVMVPFVVVIESSAAAITRALHLKGHGHGNVHTAEELKLIVSSSRGLGYLPEAEEDMIHRVLDLSAVSVREIMIPRNDIVSIPLDATLDEVLHTMNEQRHSRSAVYENAREDCRPAATTPPGVLGGTAHRHPLQPPEPCLPHQSRSPPLVFVCHQAGHADARRVPPGPRPHGDTWTVRHHHRHGHRGRRARKSSARSRTSTTEGRAPHRGRRVSGPGAAVATWRASTASRSRPTRLETTGSCLKLGDPAAESECVRKGRRYTVLR
jgi:CBS domain-containing protein